MSFQGYSKPRALLKSCEICVHTSNNNTRSILESPLTQQIHNSSAMSASASNRGSFLSYGEQQDSLSVVSISLLKAAMISPSQTRIIQQ